MKDTKIYEKLLRSTFFWESEFTFVGTVDFNILFVLSLKYDLFIYIYPFTQGTFIK